MSAEGSRRAHSASVIVALIGLLSAAVPGSLAGDEPPHGWDFTGLSRFPPANLTMESASPDLADMVTGALGLNATVGPIPRLPPNWPNSTFWDAFNRILHVSANGSMFQDPAGTELTLFYARSTREFVSLTIRFAPARPLSSSTLREFVSATAASLGLPTANSSYVEAVSSHQEQDPNGTFVEIGSRTGTLRENRGSFLVDHANQLVASEDLEFHSVIYLRLFRWFDSTPTPAFSVAEVVHAASEAVNHSRGPLSFSEFEVGIAPNYDTQAWSFLVDLRYPCANGSCRFVNMLLDSTSLEPQFLTEGFVVVDGDMPAAIPLIVAAAAIGSAIALIAYGLWRRSRPGPSARREPPQK